MAGVEIMPDPPPIVTSETAPWDAKRHLPRSRRWRGWLPWIAGLGLIGFVIYGMRTKPVAVEMATVSRGPLTVEVVEEGKTRIRNRYVIAAPIGGQMRRVTWKAGDAIKAGETVITTIEPQVAPLLDARARAQAEALLEASKAGEQKAEEGLQMAQTAAQFAQATWDRLKDIKRLGSVSINERENAERDAEMRRREVRAGEFALQVAKYERSQKEATLMQMDNPQQGGQIVEVKSPVSGVVLKVQQESSAVVMAGAALVEVGDAADLEIEAEMLSRDAVNIQPGAAVIIEQWGGEAPLQGRVRRVEPAAFTKISALGVEEQRVIVLSDLVNPPAAASRMGDRYRVEVRVAIWHSDDVLQIPTGALFREGSSWITYLFDAGKARKLTIATGHASGKFSEVLSGLQAGQQVLLHPPDSVTDGATVKLRSP